MNTVNKIVRTARLFYWWMFVWWHRGPDAELVEQVTFTQYRMTDAGRRVATELLAYWDKDRLLAAEDFYDPDQQDDQRAAQMLVTIGKFLLECRQALPILPVQMLTLLEAMYLENVLMSLRLGDYA